MYITQPIVSFSPLVRLNYNLQPRDLRVGFKYKFITRNNKQFHAEFIRLGYGPYSQVYHIKNVTGQPANKIFLYPVNSVMVFYK